MISAAVKGVSANNNTQKTRTEKERTDDFDKALKMLDWHIEETERRRKRDEARLLQEAREKKIKDKKIEDLIVLISRLRSKLSLSGGKDGDIAAQIDSAETELFWLTFSVGGGGGISM